MMNLFDQFNKDTGVGELNSMPDKKYAIKKLQRGPDGRMNVIYVDAKTGRQLNSIEGYSIIEAGSELDEVTATEDDKKKKDNTGSRVANRTVGFMGGGSDGVPTGSRVAESVAQERNPANNYGYFDKPNWMGLTSLIPGPLGMATKGANVAANINNADARDTVLTMLNQQPQDSLKGFVKDAIKDTGPYIADLEYQGRTTPVGFEAELRDGRTTLTPEEARKRMLTVPDTKVVVNEQENDGLLSGLKDTGKSVFEAAGNFIDSIFDFGDDEPERYSTNYFPQGPGDVSPHNGTTSLDELLGYDPQKPAAKGAATAGAGSTGSGSGTGNLNNNKSKSYSENYYSGGNVGHPSGGSAPSGYTSGGSSGGSTPSDISSWDGYI